jgi:hypothetical protein
VDFPTTFGACDTSANGGYDAFASRLSSSGAELLYSTFFGGTGDEFAVAAAHDPQGAVVVAGWTGSRDLPTTLGACDPSFNGGTDTFVAQFAAAGARLDYATFLGGTAWRR